MSKIILLDSNSLVNRAFYAIPQMTTRNGIFTNAIYGYLSMLARLIQEQQPTHIAAVFDLRAATFRHKMYDGYKATRKGMPEELAMQMPILKMLLQTMKIKILELEGYEADDIIGTIGKRFDQETIIVSGDRDVLQLVDDSTVVFNTKRGVTDIKVYDLKALQEENFTPKKVIEYKGLAGDSSDNIPGCTGVGEKTALSLLESYGDIDNVYKHVEELKGKLKERLIQYKQQVYLSKELATICTEVPIACTLEDLAFNEAMPAAFFDMLLDLECKSLITRYKKGTEEIKIDIDKKPVRKKLNIINVSTVAEIKASIPKRAKQFSLLINKDIHYAFDAENEYIVSPAISFFGESVSEEDALSALKAVLEGDATKIIYDCKSLFYHLKPFNITLKKPYEDVLLKAYLMDASRTIKSVDNVLSNFGYEESAAASLIALNLELDERLVKLNVMPLYKDVELPLIEVLYDMEQTGFTIDLDVLDSLSTKFAEEISSLTKEIKALANNDSLNINSNLQLGDLLFKQLNLAHSKKTKTGFSVSAEVLEELDHPIVTLILRYRKLSKLQSTYISGMRSVMDKSTNRVHTVFKQCLTATGRLSSTEPNLQNIPIRSDEGREIRKMFVASEGNALVSADYSQIELRLLAHFSQDEVLIDAYNNNMDIHAITASKIFETPLSSVTKAQRRDAKAVNFGIIYGISAFGLAKNTGRTPYEAKIFQQKYFETYQAVKPYMDSNVKTAIENGYITTISGRIRFFPELKSTNHSIRHFGERAAMNMPLQGSASDIIKIAMLKVYNALKTGGFKAKLILQVHDELVIDAPIAEITAVKKLLIENMESAVKLNVPLVADAEEGKDWFHMK